MAEPRDNCGTLSRNDKRATDKHPTHRGKALIGGVKYWVSAWVKEGQYGKFFSLAFTPADQPAEPAAAPAADTLDDDILF